MTREEVRATLDAYEEREAREAPLVKAFGRCTQCGSPGANYDHLRGEDAICIGCGGDGHGEPSAGECVVCGDVRRAGDTTEYCEECQDKADRAHQAEAAAQQREDDDQRRADRADEARDDRDEAVSP